MKEMRVLSLPSRHPYTSKLNVNGIVFVNPNDDLFSSGLCSPEYLNKNHPPSSYDIVHIHFSFDRLTLEKFENILKYFRSHRKPIVWTAHSRESQRIRNYGEGRYQQLLFHYADRVISPTKRAVKWLEKRYGRHHHAIVVIPLGFMADPRDIKRLQKKAKKDPLLFTMLIGEFRQNKEFVQSIINFLQCSDLADYRLQLIFKPMSLYDDIGRISDEMSFFYLLMQHPRIETLSRPEITNDELNSAFLRSHAIILPYRWGTHSGQIELAKDCGCHVVASNVGFYKEQWQDVCLYDVSENSLETARNYTNALIVVSRRPSLKPMGMDRLKELNESVKRHLQVYEEVLVEFSD